MSVNPIAKTRLLRWREISSVCSFTFFFSCLIVSGYLYAVGGHDGIIYLKTVERYNPVTNEWTFVASMGARRGGVGVATLGGCLYATGGYDGASNLSTSGKTTQCS